MSSTWVSMMLRLVKPMAVAKLTAVKRYRKGADVNFKAESQRGHCDAATEDKATSQIYRCCLRLLLKTSPL